MNANKAQKNYEQLGAALVRLAEIIALPVDHVGRTDAVIQRFEFVIELFWKTFKHALEDKGIVVQTPRDAVAGAYQATWIDDETVWISMLKDRNLSSHTYNETLAAEILSRIVTYLPTLQFAHRSLPQKAKL